MEKNLPLGDLLHYINPEFNLNPKIGLNWNNELWNARYNQKKKAQLFAQIPKEWKMDTLTEPPPFEDLRNNEKNVHFFNPAATIQQKKQSQQ